MLLLLLSGCASTPAPTDELSAARRALTSAQEAGAAEYAPMELRFARENLGAAETFISQRKHADARRQLEEAGAHAELAAAKARAARLRADAQAKEAENAALRRELLGDGGRP